MTRKTVRSVVGIVLFLLWLAAAPIALAMPMTAEAGDTFDQFLIWASNAGVWAVVGWLLTWVVDLFGTQFENLVPPRWRRPVMLVLCELIPVLAALVRFWMGYVPELSFEALIWPAITAGFVAFGEYAIVTGARKLPKTSEFLAAKTTARARNMMYVQGERFSWRG